VTREPRHTNRPVQIGLTFRISTKYKAPVFGCLEDVAVQNHVSNGVGHFDVCGPDAAKLLEFYAGVFDWTIQSKGPGYALIETPSGSPNGAIVESESAALRMGIVVPDLDQAMSATVEHGGQVAMPVTDNGWVKKAVVVDPAGNELTIIQA
jgi:predicted enzyme related to lactoylglutathione lyase